MKARRGTWHYRLNDYFFGSGYSEDSHNVCPYFWATLLAIGLCWLKWIVVTITKLTPNVELPSLSYDQKDRIGRFLGWGAIASIITVTMVFGSIGYWDEIFEIVIVLIIVTAIIGGGLIGIMLMKERYDKWRYNHPKKNKPRKEPKPNLVKEKVGAWYHKHCPRLEWVE